MKKVELMKELKRFNEFGDLSIIELSNEILVDIEDFEGFDEDWEEIFREPKFNEDEFISFLVDNSKNYENNFYTTYYFEDCSLVLGYSSYDI